jgi:hypothetical protein
VFLHDEEYKEMQKDDLIFLGAANLLGRMVNRKPPDPADIKSVVETARNLYAEVIQQHEDARLKKEARKP